jgi:hypothetical protein
MSKRLQLLCIYAGYLVVVVMFIALWPLADFIPPPDPNDGPQEIADRYLNNTDGIRAGMVMIIIFAALLLPWGGAIATQLKRIEGRYSPLVYAQIAGAALLALEFIYPCVVFATAAYRPEADPETIQRLNDLAWLAFLGVASTGIVQAVIFAILTLSDKRADPIYPRWYGYFNLWCATLFIPADLIFFFKDGPFAWNGILAWWVALTAFSAWLLVVTYMTARAIKRMPDDEVAGPTDGSELTALREEVAGLRAEVAGLSTAARR